MTHYTRYLDRPRPNAYSAADEVLLDGLARIVREGPREISQIQERPILSPGTAFYYRPVASIDRVGWFDDAAGATEGCDIVFLDPDKGLARTAARTSPAAYAAIDEVLKLYARGQTVVVIQFLHRLEPHVAQLRSWVEDLAAMLPGGAPSPFALRWRGATSLGFLVIPSVGLAATIQERVSDLLASPWGNLFEPCWRATYPLP